MAAVGRVLYRTVPEQAVGAVAPLLARSRRQAHRRGPDDDQYSQLRVGLRRDAHEVIVDFENLGDENYRDLSWGMDGPGRGVTVRYGFRF
jgi:hypothetical protein